MARYTKAAREEAIEFLRTRLAPGTTIYTIVTHVAKSGMSRHIKLYAILADRDGKPYMQWLSGYAARALEYSQDYRSGALKVGGCGMDMCWHVVNSLGAVVHGRDNKATVDGAFRKEDL